MTPPDETAMRPLPRLLLQAFALVTAGNALWMLAHAWSWFRWIPGVADTGAANAHLIHDVGIAYLVCAAGLAWCSRHPGRGHPVMVGVALFFGGHALGHVVEILAGQLPPSHWLIDAPLVFAPGIALAVLALPWVWRKLLQPD